MASMIACSFRQAIAYTDLRSHARAEKVRLANRPLGSHANVHDIPVCKMLTSHAADKTGMVYTLSPPASGPLCMSWERLHDRIAL